MENEIIHFSGIIGIILTIMGGFSFIYGFIIPTQNFPMNDFPSSLFKIFGIVLLIIGVILMIYLRRYRTFQAEKTSDEGIDI